MLDKKVFCFTCDKELMKTFTQLSHSKSGKYFCNKSCQTKWRNAEFVGSKHANFKDGKQSYQSVLKGIKFYKFVVIVEEKI